MRFALLGNHPDGLAIARALVASARHQIAIYAGAATGMEVLARDGIQPAYVRDPEEALASAGIEAVIVAGPPGRRAGPVRRALQSELHVLCVHPVSSLDFAYEAALLQSDVRCVLLPLFPATMHPGVRRLGEISRGLPGDSVRIVESEREFPEEFLMPGGRDGSQPGLPDWDILRFLAGELAEVSVVSQTDELAAEQPLLLTGRFVRGPLLKATYSPNRQSPAWRLTLVGKQSRAELSFRDGWPGHAELRHTDETGQTRGETWESFHPWAALVEEFDKAVDHWQTRGRLLEPGATDGTSVTADPPLLGWLDETRALELDDAARRSARYHRAVTLDLQDATEEASFKGAMTLVGCGLLWLTLLLAILSIWLPALGWLILPVLGVFLTMQLLRWIVPEKKRE
jgi:predicted dehydrogenase